MSDNHIDDMPPDEWDEVIPAASGSGRTRPYMDPESERLRSAWVASVRRYHERRTGEECVYQSKPFWDGGFCKSSGRTYKPYWPTVVARVREMGIDPVALVEALFSFWVGTSAPKPPDIVSGDNLARYRSNEATASRRVFAAIKTEEAVYRSALWAAGLSIPDPKGAVRHVLNDTGRALSPLFRYCVAVMSGVPDVAARWRIAAVHQYKKLPAAYHRSWREILPADLSAADLSA